MSQKSEDNAWRPNSISIQMGKPNKSKSLTAGNFSSAKAEVWLKQLSPKIASPVYSQSLELKMT